MIKNEAYLFHQIDGSVAISVFLGGISPMFKQQFDNVVLALGCTLVKRCEPPQDSDID